MAAVKPESFYSQKDEINTFLSSKNDFRLFNWMARDGIKTPKK